MSLLYSYKTTIWKVEEVCPDILQGKMNTNIQNYTIFVIVKFNQDLDVPFFQGVSF